MKDAGIGFGQRGDGRLGIRYGIELGIALERVEGGPRWLL
jgi:hypothetical protein